MSVKLLDMEKYARRAHFSYFRTLPYPYAGVTVDVDVKDALCYAREKKRSFYLTILHAAALAADEVPEFRQRIRGEQIAEYSECPTSHVELPDGRNYCYCTLYHHMDIDEYFERAEKTRRDCVLNGITEAPEVESMYFISTVPWFRYTALVQPAAGGDESNPRITWGKFEEDGTGRMMMPVSVLVHHALVDGIQIARFYQNLDLQIRRFGEM